MKKYTMILILCLIVVLSVTACQKEDNDKQKETEVNTELSSEVNAEADTEASTEADTEVNTEADTEAGTETNTEENSEVNTQNTESTVNNDTTEIETELPEKTDVVGLTEEEVKWFATEFFNTEENKIVNMFLTSEYTQAQDIDLGELFYNGTYADDNYYPSDEEVKLLKERYDTMDLDVSRTTTEEMNTILQKYMGLTLEETNKVQLDGLYYLKEYDAYYSVAGDTTYMRYTIGSGWKNADGTITIEYTSDDLFNGEQNAYKVTLKEVDGNYHFVSNESVK